MLKSGHIASMIFGTSRNWKNHSGSDDIELSKRSIYELSAINSGVKEIREIIDKAKNQNLFQVDILLFFS